MEQTAPRWTDRRYKPYDPADSPGPIPDVVERLRPRRRDEPDDESKSVTAELARYVVVLVTPEHAEALGHSRSDTGLMLYIDDEWDCYAAFLDDAVRIIEDESDLKVKLVEHHADLTYWTAVPAGTNGSPT